MVLRSLGFNRWDIRLSFSGPDRRRWKEIWSSTRCAERFVSIVWYERLLRIVSLSPRVEEPNSEVKKLINVRTWPTVSSPVNVLSISLYLNLYMCRWIEILWLWYDYGYVVAIQHSATYFFSLWLVIGTYILLFLFSVICWSYLRTEISVTLSIGNNLYSRHHISYFSFLWKPLCWCYLSTALNQLTSSTALCR